jgi:hypothetical protein
VHSKIAYNRQRRKILQPHIRLYKELKVALPLNASHIKLVYIMSAAQHTRKIVATGKEIIWPESRILIDTNWVPCEKVNNATEVQKK